MRCDRFQYKIKWRDSSENKNGRGSGGAWHAEKW